YLYNDVRLMAGGSAYSTGWSGATREMSSVAEDDTLTPILDAPIPSPGYINIFDKPYEKGSKIARPGLYMGTPSYDVIDEDEFPCCSSQSILAELRCAIIPLVIDLEDQNFYTVRDMRDQLIYNIRKILMDHIIDDYWYELRLPGKTGGGELSIRTWES